MENQEENFLTAINELKETARAQGNCLEKEQVDSFLAEMELTEGQKELVFEYLKTNKIGIDQPLADSEILEKEDFNYLMTYMEELETITAPTDGEKRAVTMSAIAGDITAKQRMIEIYLSHVVEIAKLYTGQGVDLADLIGEGNVALAMGVEMLGCLEKPEEADGMLGKMIMDAMEQFIEEETGEHKKDNKVLKLTNKVQKASADMAQELGRKVTIEELCEETKMSRESVLRAISISAEKMEYIEGAGNADTK